MNTQNREQWLTEAADLLAATVIAPAIERTKVEVEHNVTIAVSIGHPKTKGALGECWNKAASADGQTNQIFITPHNNDSLRILDVLLHEMLHAYDNNKSGHKGRFALLARACGLEGKLTATVAGAELTQQLLDIVDALGEIPHHALDESKAGRKVQQNRNLLVFCGPLDDNGQPIKEGAAYGCGFKFNTSATQIDRLAANAACPCCGEAWLFASIQKHQSRV